MARSGSSQYAAPGLLAIGFRDVVHDLGIIGQSLKTIGKSCGVYNDARLSTVNSIPTHLARVGNPGPKSTTTSNIAPRVQRTSLISSYGAAWKQAPQGVAMLIERDAPLRVMRAKTSLYKQIAAERTCKKTSIIFELLKLDD